MSNDTFNQPITSNPELKKGHKKALGLEYEGLLEIAGQRHAQENGYGADNISGVYYRKRWKP